MHRFATYFKPYLCGDLAMTAALNGLYPWYFIISLHHSEAISLRMAFRWALSFLRYR